MTKRDLFVNDKLYKIQEIANILGVSERTVRSYIYSGALTAFRDGKTVRIHENALKQFQKYCALKHGENSLLTEEALLRMSGKYYRY